MKHECSEESVQRLRVLSERRGFDGSYEVVEIARCRKCGKLWKIRRQLDSGSGKDDFWLRVGEEERGLTFTEKEAREALGLNLQKR